MHYRDVPRNLKKEGVAVSTENIGEDQKKKVFSSFDVQFTPQNQVKTKKKKKKVNASSDVLFR